MMNNSEESFLIVDDEPEMCWTFEHILGKKGFVAQKALNGQQALQLIEARSFSLVFLDAKLPDIEGLELAKFMRKVDPAIRIVMVSGYFYKDDISIQQALAEGLISGFIGKPFRHEEILNAIEINNGMKHGNSSPDNWKT